MSDLGDMILFGKTTASVGNKPVQYSRDGDPVDSQTTSDKNIPEIDVTGAGVVPGHDFTGEGLDFSIYVPVIVNYSNHPITSLDKNRFPAVNDNEEKMELSGAVIVDNPLINSVVDDKPQLTKFMYKFSSSTDTRNVTSPTSWYYGGKMTTISHTFYQTLPGAWGLGCAFESEEGTIMEIPNEVYWGKIQWGKAFVTFADFIGDINIMGYLSGARGYWNETSVGVSPKDPEPSADQFDAGQNNYRYEADFRLGYKDFKELGIDGTMFEIYAKREKYRLYIPQSEVTVSLNLGRIPIVKPFFSASYLENSVPGIMGVDQTLSTYYQFQVGGTVPLAGYGCDWGSDSPVGVRAGFTYTNTAKGAFLGTDQVHEVKGFITIDFDNLLTGKNLTPDEIRNTSSNNSPSSYLSLIHVAPEVMRQRTKDLQEHGHHSTQTNNRQVNHTDITSNDDETRLLKEKRAKEARQEKLKPELYSDLTLIMLKSAINLQGFEIEKIDDDTLNVVAGLIGKSVDEVKQMLTTEEGKKKIKDAIIGNNENDLMGRLLKKDSIELIAQITKMDRDTVRNALTTADGKKLLAEQIRASYKKK